MHAGSKNKCPNVVEDYQSNSWIINYGQMCVQLEHLRKGPNVIIIIPFLLNHELHHHKRRNCSSFQENKPHKVTYVVNIIIIKMNNYSYYCLVYNCRFKINVVIIPNLYGLSAKALVIFTIIVENRCSVRHFRIHTSITRMEASNNW